MYITMIKGLHLINIFPKKKKKKKRKKEKFRFIFHRLLEVTFLFFLLRIAN